MTLNLDNFILEEYNTNYSNHKEVLEQLSCDQETKKYLGNLQYTIQKINQRKAINNLNFAWIAYYKDGSPIGFLTLSYMEASYQISCSILPEYRRQNLGALLLQEATEKIFEEYQQIEEIILKIDQKNIGSIKMADLAGYSRENETTFREKRR